MPSDTVGGEAMQSWLDGKKFTDDVAAAYKVKTYFDWQPVPVYNHDIRCDIAQGGVPQDARYDSVKGSLSCRRASL